MDPHAAIQRQHSPAFDIGPCRIEPERNRIVRRGEPVHVEPRVMDLLLVLWSRPGEVISNEDLIQRVWHGSFISDHVVTHAVWQLRRALGDPHLVQSIPKRGYRLALEGVVADHARTEYSVPAPAEQRSSIVVLPLANLGGNSEWEYFTDGMTDALTTRLAQFSNLRVISRTSAMHYRSRAKPITTIASELDVDTIIEGSVLRIGNRVRVSVQLIDARSDSHLWAGTYDRDLEDVLALQSSLADVIVSKISTTLRKPAHQAGPLRVKPQAYEAYLRGRFCWLRFSAEGFDVALNYFQQAAELDPTFAQPWSGIAQVWFARENSGFVRPLEAAPLSRDAAQRALSLDNNSAEAHAAIGLVNFHFDWDRSAAEGEFRTAIALDPNDSANRIFYSDLLFSTLHPDEGFEQIRNAIRIDPLAPAPRCFLGWYLLFLRRVDLAIPELLKAIEIEPAFGAAHQGLWGAYYLQRKWDSAFSEARTFFSIRGQSSLIPSRPGRITEPQYRDIMREAAEEMIHHSRTAYVRNIRIARLFAHAGDATSAITFLERAFCERESPLVHLAVAWDWEAISAHSGFISLVDRIGIVPTSKGID